MENGFFTSDDIQKKRKSSLPPQSGGTNHNHSLSTVQKIRSGIECYLIEYCSFIHIKIIFFKEKFYLHIFIPLPPTDKDSPSRSETHQQLPSVRQSAMQHSRRQ